MFIADTMGGGVGLFDYDNDGWLDIYFVNGCAIPFDGKDLPRPNRLYRNQRDGTFRDVTAKAGVGGRGYGMGCTTGDYDNDGDRRSARDRLAPDDPLSKSRRRDVRGCDGLRRCGNGPMDDGGRIRRPGWRRRSGSRRDHVCRDPRG